MNYALSNSSKALPASTHTASNRVHTATNAPADPALMAAATNNPLHRIFTTSWLWLLLLLLILTLLAIFEWRRRARAKQLITSRTQFVEHIGHKMGPYGHSELHPDAINLPHLMPKLTLQKRP